MRPLHASPMDGTSTREFMSASGFRKDDDDQCEGGNASQRTGGGGRADGEEGAKPGYAYIYAYYIYRQREKNHRERVRQRQTCRRERRNGGEQDIVIDDRFEERESG